ADRRNGAVELLLGNRGGKGELISRGREDLCRLAVLVEVAEQQHDVPARAHPSKVRLRPADNVDELQADHPPADIPGGVYEPNAIWTPEEGRRWASRYLRGGAVRGVVDRDGAVGSSI